MWDDDSIRWHEHAACRDHPSPDIFFPDAYNPLTVSVATSVCAPCRVKEMCLSWAVSHAQLYGIYGGTTPIQRRELRRGQMMLAV